MTTATTAATLGRTWKATLYLLQSGALGGTTALIVLSRGHSFGFKLTLLAAVILVGLCWVVLAERAVLAALLGARIPSPYLPVSDGPSDGRWRGRISDPAIARDLAYLAVLVPLGLLWSALLAASWALAIALISLPVWYRAIPDPATLFGEVQAGDLDAWWYTTGWDEITWWMAALAAFGGVLLAVGTALATGRIAAGHARIARRLLSPSPAAELAHLEHRVRTVETARARAVGGAAAERRRIERDLHDGTQVRLVRLAMELGQAQEKFDSDPAAARTMLDWAHREAKATIVELRNLARGIHPAVLTDRGLDAALSALTAHAPVPVAITVDVGDRPAPETESIAYFVIAEALANVAKHAQATAVTVLVRRAGNLLVVEVRDDGHGGAVPGRGGGLAGLADRVLTVEGALSVRSPDGGPTVVRAELPCGS